MINYSYIFSKISFSQKANSENFLDKFNINIRLLLTLCASLVSYNCLVKWLKMTRRTK